MSKYYYLTGLVYGKNWGGGYGAYPARKLQDKTEQGLLKQAKQALKDGSLDSGMGFESLKGALLTIEEYQTITIEGKQYHRSEFSDEFIGELTDKEQDFLLEITGG